MAARHVLRRFFGLLAMIGLGAACTTAAGDRPNTTITGPTTSGSLPPTPLYQPSISIRPGGAPSGLRGAQLEGTGVTGGISLDPYCFDECGHPSFGPGGHGTILLDGDSLHRRSVVRWGHGFAIAAPPGTYRIAAVKVSGFPQEGGSAECVPAHTVVVPPDGQVYVEFTCIA